MPPSNDLIRSENERPGDRRWMLDRTEVDPASRYRCRRIEGFCSVASATAGESIDVSVSVDPPSLFTLDLYRLGWYGGAGGRKIASHGPVHGSPQPEPMVGPERVRECLWPPSISIRVAPDWASGVYLGKLSALDDGVQSYVTFVVRDRRPADFLFQCATNTWQACGTPKPSQDT